MKKIIVSTLAAGLLAAPAFAASITISFASDEGATQVWTFDDSTMTATTGELSTSYTWDAETSTLCADIPEEGEVCATFESTEAPTVGGSSAYTLSTGGSGVATITEMTE